MKSRGKGTDGSASPAKTSESPRDSRRALAIGLGLAALTALVLSPVLAADFVDLDDGLYVTENARALDGVTGGGFVWAWTTFHAGLWLPLTWLSLQLDASVFGREAWGFHLTNLALHVANVVLLFWVVRRMTGALWPAALVAALFAVHPLHVESVAWVSERKDVLSTFFCLLTMAGYAHYAAQPSWRRYLGVAIPYALGLLSKPMLVTLPCALLLLDYWPLRRLRDAASPTDASPAFGLATWKDLVVEKIPLFMLAAVGSVVTFIAQRDSGAVLDWTSLPWDARLSNAVESYGVYLFKTVWPDQLGVFYPHSLRMNVPAFLLGLLVLGVITAACYSQTRESPAWLVGWLWFLGTLVPVIGLVQVGEQARADRFTYVPHIGLFLGVVFGLSGLVQRWHWSARACALLAGSVILLLSVSTYFQATYWRNARALWEHTLAATGQNYRAHFNLGLIALGEGRVDDARDHFEESLALMPNQKTHHELGLIYLSQGQYRRAAGHFQEVLRVPSEAARAHKNLGVCWLNLQDWQKAQEHFREAQRLQPHFENEQNLGVAYLMAGKLALAKEIFRAATALAPSNTHVADAQFRLGLVFLLEKDWEGALPALHEAVRLRPREVSFLHHAAFAHAQLGKKDEAQKLYRDSLAQQPSWPSETAHRAMVLAMHAEASHRSPVYALQLATQACEATDFRRVELLDILAATHAAIGDFPAAEQTVVRALELATQPAQRQHLLERLSAYQQKRALWLPAPQ